MLIPPPGNQLQVASTGLDRLERAITGEICVGPQAYDNLKYLCDDIGSRWGGSENEKKAAEFLALKMREYGLQRVRLEEFDCLCWERNGFGRLEVLEPLHRELGILPLPYTIAGTTEGELVIIHEGTPEEFQRRADEIRQKIVLASPTSPTGAQVTRRIHRPEKHARSEKAGALAFLWMNLVPGQLHLTGSICFGRESHIPAASVSLETGSYLARLAAKGPVRLRITTCGKVRPGKSWNVVGEICGKDSGGPTVLAGAHYDSHDVGCGAMDNGSGTVCILEAARALAMHADEIPGSLKFVCFSQEETGLFGSEAYAAAHAEEMKDLRFMFNVDGVGFDAGSKSFALQAQSGLVGFFKCLLQEIGLKTVVDNGISPYWDHFPFFRAGVPCGSLSNMDVRETLGRYCHSSADTLDKISEPDLRLTSAAVARALLAIVRAGEGDWKETRRSAEEIVKALEDDNWMESLEFAGHRL